MPDDALVDGARGAQNTLAAGQLDLPLWRGAGRRVEDVHRPKPPIGVAYRTLAAIHEREVGRGQGGVLGVGAPRRVGGADEPVEQISRVDAEAVGRPALAV